MPGRLVNPGRQRDVTKKKTLKRDVNFGLKHLPTGSAVGMEFIPRMPNPQEWYRAYLHDTWKAKLLASPSFIGQRFRPLRNYIRNNGLSHVVGSATMSVYVGAYAGIGALAAVFGELDSFIKVMKQTHVMPYNIAEVILQSYNAWAYRDYTNKDIAKEHLAKLYHNQMEYHRAVHQLQRIPGNRTMYTKDAPKEWPFNNEPISLPEIIFYLLPSLFQAGTRIGEVAAESYDLTTVTANIMGIPATYQEMLGNLMWDGWEELKKPLVLSEITSYIYDMVGAPMLLGGSLESIKNKEIRAAETIYPEKSIHDIEKEEFYANEQHQQQAHQEL